MGLSVITALEIFTNPYDLEFLIKKGGDGKYAFAVLRGPGHEFKPLLSTPPFTDDLEVAITTVEKTLKAIREVSERELGGGGIIALLFNPHREQIDSAKVLSENLVTIIIEALRRHQIASTYKLSSD